MRRVPTTSIAVLGAGPIGIEAALYARTLGYRVAVFERGRVGDNVSRWGHVRLFSPFSMNSSPLGRATLLAQAPRIRQPAQSAILTANEWIDKYLLPLSQTELLADTVSENTQVIRVGRRDCLKRDMPGRPERGASQFRILTEDSVGQQRVETADVVIDCTGVFGNPNWIGPGGIPAIGETSIRKQIEFGIPDICGRDRARYEGRRILVVGGGYSAATNVVSLMQLMRPAPDTKVVWVTRHPLAESDIGPIPLIPNDRLAERDKLARAANQSVHASSAGVQHHSGTVISGIAYDSDADQFRVQFCGRHAGEEQFDRVLANVGFRPDRSIYDELQVHLCYASDGPMKLAAELLGQTSADCLDQTSSGSQALRNPEPNFYVLGAKSYGRNSKFLVAIGLMQIRDVFQLIAGSDHQDLYSSQELISP